MRFRTELKLHPLSRPAKPDGIVFSIGSCFATEIRDFLSERFIPVETSPGGIVYHPLAINQTLRRILNDQRFGELDLVQTGELWATHEHHGSLARPDPAAFLTKANQDLSSARRAMARAATLIVTWGTAYAFRKGSLIVTNCLKRPDSEFERALIPGDEIARDTIDLVRRLQATVPGLRTVLTVSPVRHLRDDFRQNQISKSHLHIAAEAVCDALNDVEYFPAYELMMDDLRDYRFYDDSLTHPSPAAIDYIAEKFRTWLYGESSREYFAAADTLRSRLAHRPLHDTAAARAFLAQNDEKRTEFLCRFPGQVVPPVS